MINKIKNLWWAWKNRCKDVKSRHGYYLSPTSFYHHSGWIDRAFIPCKVCGDKYCRWAVNRYTKKTCETI